MSDIIVAVSTVVSTVISDVVTKLLTKFIDETEPENEFKQFLGEYLDGYYAKYSKIKPFLHGEKLIDIKDIYYPLKIQAEEQIIASAEDLFAADSVNCITIIGDAGGGKSTFVKNMFMDVIDENRAVPFFVELRSIQAKHDSLEDFLFSELGIDEKIHVAFKTWFKEGNCIFFLDGYDEFNRDDKVQLLGRFINLYPKNKFILTSRPSAGANYLERFENFRLLNLDDDDVFKFTDQQLKFMDDGKALKDGLTKSLQDGLESDMMESFLHNPLLLCIYISTYKSNPDVPKKKHLFYQQIFEALFYQHDASSKPGFKRGRTSDLDRGNFENFLKQFSYRTYMNEYYDWNRGALNEEIDTVKAKLKLSFNNKYLINDMLVSIPLWVEDDGQYSFSHRSFQEYFASNYIKDHAQKIEVYRRIVDKKFSNRWSNREIINLLSLLEESDSQVFIEHVKIPMFDKMKKSLMKMPNNLYESKLKACFL